MKWSEGDLEHEWVVDTKSDDFKWADLPHVDAEFKLLQTSTKDDPICNSSGCTQYLFPKGPDDPPRDYPVPDFGIDQNILAS